MGLWDIEKIPYVGREKGPQEGLAFHYYDADKVVAAAAQQMEAIRRIDKLYGLDSLPDKLQEAALLRFANPEASLADLAMLSYPPVSKSCLSHRLKKLLDYKPEGID